MKHIAKRVIALALTMVMVLSLTSWASAADFVDMPTGWAKEAVEAAVENGLLSGKSDGRLDPTGNLKRAEMAAIVVRAFGKNYSDDLAAFTDVLPSAWYMTSGELGAAYTMGIINGKSATQIKPNDNITREEAFTILARALKLEDGAAADVAKFTDAGSLHSWGLGPVAAMVKAGYVEGSNNALNPGKAITRQEFAKVMFEIFSDYISAQGTVTEVGDKSVVVSNENVTLKGVTVKGDLIIGEGAAEGDVTLDNVTINGRLVVRGGGVNSVHIIGGSKVPEVVLAKVVTDVRVVVEGAATAVGKVVKTAATGDAKTGKAVVEGNVDTIVLDTNDDFSYSNGTVKNIVANGTGNVNLENAKVENVEQNGAGQVTAKDTEIENVTVTAPKAYLTLNNGAKVGNVKVDEKAEEAIINVNTGASISKVETDANITIAGKGSVGEKKANGDAEIKEEEEIIVRPEDPTDDTTSSTGSAHKHSAGEEPTYTYYDKQSHKYTCADAECSEEILEAHTIKTKAEDDLTEAEQAGISAGSAEGAAEGDEAQAETVTTYTFCTKCFFVFSTETVAKGEKALCKDGKHVWEKKAAAADAPVEGEDGNVDEPVTQADEVEDETPSCEVKPDPVEWECKLCGATKTTQDEAPGHVFNIQIKNQAPTCYAEGEKQFKCSVCGTEGEALTMTKVAHTFTRWVANEGGTTHKLVCSVVVTPAQGETEAVYCDGASEITEETHTLTLKTVTNPDYNAQDANSPKTIKVPACTKCDYEGNEAHPAEDVAEGHTFGEEKKPAGTNDENRVHVQTCAVSGCNAKKYSDDNHTWETVEAVKTGKCSVCGYVCTHAAGYNRTPNNEDGGHDVVCKTCEKVASNEAHKWNETSVEGKCYLCDGGVHDCAAANSWIKDSHGEAIRCAVCYKAHTHDEGSVVVNNRNGTHDKKCICGKVITAAAACTYEKDTAEGATTHTCSVCSAKVACDHNGEEGKKCSVCGREWPAADEPATPPEQGGEGGEGGDTPSTGGEEGGGEQGGDTPGTDDGGGNDDNTTGGEVEGG